jgi:hypothetical protein
MSKFSDLSDRTLKLIMDQVKEQFEDGGLDVESVGDYVQNGNIVDDICKYVGLDDLSFEDLSYLCGLFIDNVDTEPPFKRPRLKKFKITHKEDYVKYGSRHYQNVVGSYARLDSDDLYTMQSEGIYEYWDGRVVYDDVYDEETNHDEITDIDVID